ncbi:hypothetical protein J1N35_041119 [Gossypium stocksii]|uniref:Uncharacterized protein n=1 Tax=Gossypium stocksii TaxID=47602 RepID=A0A9D3UF53_9ROSI|nr:hypothetical protein J1N35_041119 [Gossypium stocksii]
MVRSFPSSSKEFIKLAKDLMTRAQARHFLKVALALIIQIWVKTKLDSNVKAQSSSTKNPCILVQVEHSSFPAPRAPFSSNQLI